MPWVTNPNAPKLLATIDLDREAFSPLAVSFETDANFNDIVSGQPIVAVVPGVGADYDGNVFGVNVPHVAAGKLTVGGQIENTVPLSAQRDLTDPRWLTYNSVILSPTTWQPVEAYGTIYIDFGVGLGGYAMSFRGSVDGPDTLCQFQLQPPLTPPSSTIELTTETQTYIRKSVKQIGSNYSSITDYTWEVAPFYIFNCTDFQKTAAIKAWYRLPDNFTGTIYPGSSGALGAGHYWPMSPSLRNRLSTAPLNSDITVVLEFPFVLEDFYFQYPLQSTLLNERVDIMSLIDGRGMLFLDVYMRNNRIKVLYAFLVFSDGTNRAEVPFDFQVPFTTYHIQAKLNGTANKMRIGYSTDGESYTFGDEVPFVGSIPGSATATQVTVGWDESEFLVLKKITIF